MGIAKRIEKLELVVDPPEEPRQIVMFYIKRAGESEYWKAHEAEIDQYVNEYIERTIAETPGKPYSCFTIRKNDDGTIGITGG